MKTITISDEDYKTLMDLSKELQTQENDYQAFPYYWEPSSLRTERNFHGEGAIVVAYDCRNCEKTTPKELIEEAPDLWESFLELSDHTEDTPYESIESEWVDHIKDDVDYDVWTEDLEDQQERNHSLFKSDVKDFIDTNKHHLGKNPHTYSRTIWRMPKMEALIGAVIRINREHSEEVNHEAKRFVNKGMKQ